jgi:hypothetical protein
LSLRLSVSQPSTNRLHYSHSDFNKTTKQKIGFGVSNLYRQQIVATVSEDRLADQTLFVNLKGEGSIVYEDCATFKGHIMKDALASPCGIGFFGLLEWQLRGNVIIRKAQRAIQAGECRPRRRSSSRFPLLAPTRDSFESGASAVARVSDRGCLAEV